MNYFGHDGGFWSTVIGAAFIRIITADYEGPWFTRILRGVATAFMAIFSAVVATEPALDVLSLPPDTYKIPMAALIALTGEGLMRMLMNISWSQALEALRAWRGK